ncbi:hypothetical protein [Rhodovarius sp.]|uniref:hypothetical protein n=1 Tax=Rhodovarius sp. TaxID=2972673 RepID=UPI00333EBB84
MYGLNLPDPLTDSLAALLVFTLTYAQIRIGLLLYSMVAPADAEAVPLLHVTAIIAGLLLGLPLLAGLPHAADFQPARLYAADSPWAIGVIEFVYRFTLPNRQTLNNAWLILSGADPLWVALIGYIGLALATLAALQAAMLWKGMAGARAALAGLLLAGWTALVVHHLAHLLAWSATHLNFWLFALALLLWQRMRYAPAHRSH